MPSSVESSPARRSPASTSAAAAAARPYLTPIPLIFDSLTFDDRQDKWIKDLERKMDAEKKRKQREWEREVQKMRDEFLQLHAADRHWGSDELLVDPLVARRRGSTDTLDVRRMKTMYSSSSHDAHSRYRLRFDLTGFDFDSVRVSVSAERIVVRASRVLESGERREYARKIQKPVDVDVSRIKSSLTSDGVLTVGASLQSPKHSRYQSPSSRCRTPSFSPSKVLAPPPPELKPGVPVFRDEVAGQRRLHLCVDVGAMFKPSDVTVQIIKENRLVVRGRHEERTSELVSKSKYVKEFELAERVDDQTVRGGFAADGRLFITALVKGHGQGHGHVVGETSIADERDGMADADDILLADARGVRLISCNVLDLASFPPSITTSAGAVTAQ